MSLYAVIVVSFVILSNLTFVMELYLLSMENVHTMIVYAVQNPDLLLPRNAFLNISITRRHFS